MVNETHDNNQYNNQFNQPTDAEKNSNNNEIQNTGQMSEEQTSSQDKVIHENQQQDKNQNNEKKDILLEKEIEALKLELDKAKNQINELKNQYLRSLADYDNLRKRTNKEVLEASDRGKEDLVKKLLPVIDSFNNAIKLLHETKVDKKILDGIEMLWFQFSDVLEKEGLKPIPALNQKFDPNFHEAIMKSTDTSKEDEIIVREFEIGYTFKNRVIRTSKVEINSK